MIYSRLLIFPADFERASAALYCHGFLGAAEEQAGPAGTRLAAAFADSKSARKAAEELAAEGISIVLEEDVPAPEDPFATFRKMLAPVRVGSFHVNPRNEPDDSPDPDAIALHIPAACAFGTGLHESTRGILRILAFEPFHGRRVVDVGCGSAILGIAAARRRVDRGVRRRSRRGF